MRWNNLLSPSKVAQAIRIESGALWSLRHGRPDIILQFLGGLGDELLLTCIAHELRGRRPGVAIWQISSAAELLRGNPDYSLILDSKYRVLRHSNLLGRWRKPLRYSEMPIAAAYEVPPREHILAILCRITGIEGNVKLRPWYFQDESEASGGRYAPRQMCVQSVGDMTHGSWMQNKVWFHDRIQCVIDEFAARHPDCHVLQIGTQNDGLLERVTDLRGKTTLRQTAAVLSQSLCFLGTSGLLAHLARAVECRSVIIYGGREHAWQSGYSCNENLETRMSCAPCWLWHDCDFDHRCMRDITVQHVLNALERVIARNTQPLEVDEVFLCPSDEPKPKSYPTTPGSQKIANLSPFGKIDPGPA
jgi:hypothetical protein